MEHRDSSKPGPPFSSEKLMSCVLFELYLVWINIRNETKMVANLLEKHSVAYIWALFWLESMSWGDLFWVYICVFFLRPPFHLLINNSLWFIYFHYYHFWYWNSINLCTRIMFINWLIIPIFDRMNCSNILSYIQFFSFIDFSWMPCDEIVKHSFLSLTNNI